MALLTNIISAIGNNSSIYPLIVRDCGIEVPIKVYKTYKQNKEDKEIAYLSTRERLIDEYATSAVWLGGIPLIGKICNTFIKKKGFAPNVSVKLLTPSADKLQSLDVNINKFSAYEDARAAVEELKQVKSNCIRFKKLMSCKLFAEMVIPILLMGFVIPKAVYALTAATRKKTEEIKILEAKKSYQKCAMNEFIKKSNFENNFCGNLSSSLCELSTLQKMAITDGGYAIGRVATARKKKGAIDIAFKMIGMLYLNFIAPKQIEKLLNGLTKLIFKLDINLDPKILADNMFVKQILGNKLELPKSDNLSDILDFIDNQKNNNSLFVRYAEKTGKIKLLNGQIRDPRFFVDKKALSELRRNMINYANMILTNSRKIKSNKEIAKAVKKNALRARTAKTFNILSNVALSSYLLACCLPNLQYFLREKILKTKLEPDLV